LAGRRLVSEKLAPAGKIAKVTCSAPGESVETLVTADARLGTKKKATGANASGRKAEAEKVTR
jgi:hypothetical protein